MNPFKRIILTLMAAVALLLPVGTVAADAVALPAPVTANAVTDTLLQSACQDSADPNCTKQTGLFGTGGIFQIVANVLIFIVGAIAVIMLIIGGLRYVLSAGEPSAIKGAKDTILYALVGIIVAFLAYAAVNFILSLFK